jgi:hypothetical protein
MYQGKYASPKGRDIGKVPMFGNVLSQFLLLPLITPISSLPLVVTLSIIELDHGEMLLASLFNRLAFSFHGQESILNIQGPVSNTKST